VSFDWSDSLGEPVEPKFRKKIKSRYAFEPLLMSNDLSVEPSANSDMDMDMDMTGPYTESHAENSITYPLADRHNMSDTWRIDVEEESDCDTDDCMPKALP
jgi:hypothetical protein